MKVTNAEIEMLAKKYNKSFEEMKSDIDIFLEELIVTRKGIKDCISCNGFIKFPDDIDIYGYGKNGELNTKYICYTPNLKEILKKDKDDVAIVSGFGATNTPTIGTLSMMLKLIEFQRETGLYTYCIINDLGSINARNIDPEYVLQLTDKFDGFLKKIGFNISNGEIRTHNDVDHARVFSLVASQIKSVDFYSNGEATDDTYERLNLKGNDFSVQVDHVYTAADVLLPIIRDQKSGIIVPCGLEEYYHANIGGIALERMKNDPRYSSLIPEGVEIGAVYSTLIPGFFPYFKQSKSIKNSSVNLGNTTDEIYDKIINCTDRDESVILDMIRFASSFDNNYIECAKAAFENRANDYSTWKKYKEEYVNYILEVKNVWDSCESKDMKLRERIFK